MADSIHTDLSKVDIIANAMDELRNPLKHFNAFLDAGTLSLIICRSSFNKRLPCFGAPSENKEENDSAFTSK
jgi:hypothetical protein